MYYRMQPGNLLNQFEPHPYSENRGTSRQLPPPPPHLPASQRSETRQGSRCHNALFHQFILHGCPLLFSCTPKSLPCPPGSHPLQPHLKSRHRASFHSSPHTSSQFIRVGSHWPESVPASSQTNTYSSIIHTQWMCQSFKGVFPRLGSETPIIPSLHPSSFLQVNCHNVMHLSIGPHDSHVAPSH